MNVYTSVETNNNNVYLSATKVAERLSFQHARKGVLEDGLHYFIVWDKTHHYEINSLVKPEWVWQETWDAAMKL